MDKVSGIGASIFLFLIASSVFAASPVTDTFDNFNSLGWTAITSNTYASTTSGCTFGGCIKTKAGGQSIIEKTGDEIMQGGFVFYGRRNVGFSTAIPGIFLAHGPVDSGQYVRVANQFMPNDDSWHLYTVFWREGINLLKEFCLLSDSTTINNCSWTDTISGQTMSSTTTIDTIRFDAQVGRDDLGDRIWWDELQHSSTTPLGHVSTSTTLEAGKVYVVSGNISIDSGVTLNIQPGARIKFDTSTTSGIFVSGSLNALGDEFGTASTSGHIFFTSLKDDRGGDTNGDASSTVPSSGDWGSITINPGGSATFNYSVLTYGGNSSSSAQIHNNGGILNIASSTLTNASTTSIRTSGGTTTIVASDIAFNQYGLYLSGGSLSIIATSTVHDNSLYSAFNSTTATSSFFAQNNYWGTSTGPYNAVSNSGGTGDPVSDYVDFDPWIGKNLTQVPHYVELEYFCPGITCASVQNKALLLDASTTAFMTDLTFATSTWSGLGNKIYFALATSSTANVAVYDLSVSDAIWIGEWEKNPTQPDSLRLNSYFMNQVDGDHRKNTIIHELGHAVGLDHSFSGNIMYFLSSSQTAPGTQDVDDFNYLWQ